MFGKSKKHEKEHYHKMKDRFANNDEHNVEGHNPSELLDLYRQSFENAIMSRYASSKVLADSGGRVAKDCGSIASGLSTASGVSDKIPVVGSIIGGIFSAFGGAYNLYKEHQYHVKAERFISFANFVGKGEGLEAFATGMVDDVLANHGYYISHLRHESSLKWVPKKLSNKLNSMFDLDDYDPHEKDVITLAHAHAKIVIKAIEKGLDPEFFEDNTRKMKHAIDATFWDESHCAGPDFYDDNQKDGVGILVTGCDEEEYYDEGLYFQIDLVGDNQSVEL